MESLDLAALREQNARRMGRWHNEMAEWSGADWSNAMCGEAGETANVVKKLRRWETGAPEGSHNTPPADELEERLASEIADTVIYADLLAHHYDLDLGAAIRAKFNLVSEAQGFPERL